MGGGGHNPTLFDQMVSAENLFAAWDRFAKGKRRRPDVQEYGRNVEDRLFALRDRLASGEWLHGPYERMTVCDPKPREIHKAAVEDRIVHHAVVRAIEPLFDRGFVFDSWSCRVGKGTVAAVERCHRLLERESRNGKVPLFALKCDIRKCFASLDHEVLLRLLGRRVRDERAMALLREIVGSFSPGVPLGNLTSQLFANVYLDPLDHFIRERLRPPVYLRYSDDFIVVGDGRRLAAILASVRSFVGRELRIELHPRKCVVRKYQDGIDWLGHVLYPGYRVLRPTTRRRVFRNLDANVWALIDGEISREWFQSVCASYDGLLRGGWNGSGRDKLMGVWTEF